ncbi:hypothetical protein B0H21DRAFT_759355, partial [Amylocystis lapponica]
MASHSWISFHINWQLLLVFTMMLSLTSRCRVQRPRPAALRSFTRTAANGSYCYCDSFYGLLTVCRAAVPSSDL